jgi:UDP-N-acetylglucosamine 1-carboxyvinyltransferase
MTTTRAPGVAAEVIAVRPGPPLTGTVTVDGSKNAALPLLAAAAALSRPVRLSNIPANTDVQIMLSLLQQADWRVAQPVGEPTTVLILPTERRHAYPELPQAARIRASYYLVPALLARHGEARLPWPGGCRIGARAMGHPALVGEPTQARRRRQ